MHLKTVAVLVAALFAVALSQSAANGKDESRFLTSLRFSVFTVIKATTTSTSTLVSTVTCTTSTAALTTCTAGRRRRGLFYSEDGPRNRRGLFFNDDDELPEATLSKSIEKRSNNPVDEVKEPTKDLIPLVIEPGFKLPDNAPVNRFLLAIGTSTVTTFTISTSTTRLTAICSSVTGFPTC